MKLNLVPEDLKIEIIELSLTFLSFYSKVLHSHWLPVFQYLLIQIPINTIKAKLIPELMLLSDLTQKQITRQISCHLLASLAEVIKKDFKGPLLHRAKALSQDTNSEVREEMAKVWITIIKVLGRTILEDTIFFDILKLIEDEVESVKAQGIILLLKSLEIVTESFFCEEALQIFRSHIYKPHSKKIEEVLAENIGQLVYVCHGEFAKENLNLVKKFAASESSRKWVAFNYPCIVKYLFLTDELCDIAILLSTDPNMEVREIFAAGIHEAISLNLNCKVLRKIVGKLIEDPITRLIIFRKLLLWADIMDPSQLLLKLIKILTQTPEWRVQCEILQRFLSCFDKFNLKEVLDHLVPLLLHKMLTACWPIKTTCAEVLAYTIHNTFFIARKLDLCNIVKDKLARSSSCFDRVLFIEFAAQMAGFVSKKFFLKHFFNEFLVVGFDKTHSVQIKFLTSALVIGKYTEYEQILNVISQVDCKDTTVVQLCNKVVSFFHSKDFLEEFKENSARDKGKEKYENLQEVKEVKELENTKRRAIDETLTKGEQPKRLKKISVRVRLSESIGPKPLSTRSTAMIKKLIPVKKK